MGAERRTLVMSEEEKRMTAYHEAGHAIVALSVPATDPVHKATIIPRGRALGMVMQLPERDQISMSLKQMTSRLSILMGGRVAEELIFGAENVTSGAQSDIQQATRLARAMVTEWGYSPEVGKINYNMRNEYGIGDAFSSDTLKKIESEVRRFVDEGYEDAKRILTERADDLDTLAKALLEYETLSGDEIKDVIAGKPPKRDEPDAEKPSRGSAVPKAGKTKKASDGDAPDTDLSPQPQG